MYSTIFNNWGDATASMISLQLRGAIFLAVACLLGWLVRKKWAHLAPIFWRSVFLSLAGVVLVSLFQPMLVVQLVRPISAVSSTSAPVVSCEHEPSQHGFAAAHENHFQTASEPAGFTQVDAIIATSGTERSGWFTWPRALGAVWLAGILALLCRPLFGLLGLLRLQRRGSPLTGPEAERCAQACKHLGIKNISIVVADEIETPFVAGLFRPVLFLPKGCSEWSEAEWEIVLSHESAHIRQLDTGVTFVAHLCLALYWINPLVWLGYRELRTAQEFSADDEVLNRGVSSETYANALIQFGRNSAALPCLATPMARPSALRIRIERILAADYPLRPSAWASPTITVLVVGLGAIAGTSGLVMAEAAVNRTLATWVADEFVASFDKENAAPPKKRLTMNIGVRALYNRVGGKLNLTWLDQVLENDLYLSGPHAGEIIDARNKISFGHYNPAALEEIIAVLDDMVANEDVVKATQKVYDREFRDILRMYLRAYYVCTEEKKGYRAELQARYKIWEDGGRKEAIASSFPRSFARDFGNAQRAKGRDFYQANTAARFWPRRMLDGTDQSFLKALGIVMGAFDPETVPVRITAEGLQVEAKIVSGKNTFQIDITKSNFPQDDLVMLVRVDDGAWKEGSEITGILEGKRKVEWFVSLAKFRAMSTPRKTVELDIVGALEIQVEETVRNLGSDDFKVRKASQQTLESLHQSVLPILKALREKATDPEVRTRLKEVIKTHQKSAVAK